MSNHSAIRWTYYYNIKFSKPLLILVRTKLNIFQLTSVERNWCLDYVPHIFCNSQTFFLCLDTTALSWVFYLYYQHPLDLGPCE